MVPSNLTVHFFICAGPAGLIDEQKSQPPVILLIDTIKKKLSLKGYDSSIMFFIIRNISNYVLFYV